MLRNLLKEHPWVGKAAAGLLILLAVLSVALSRRHSSDEVTLLSKAYYSTDDGKTWFADDINKTYPFDHAGHAAYRAFIFQNTDGSTFCGYLLRLSEPTLA
jgi:hypothetical protein